jgi:hypothetical protein
MRDINCLFACSLRAPNKMTNRMTPGLPLPPGEGWGEGKFPAVPSGPLTLALSLREREFILLGLLKAPIPTLTPLPQGEGHENPQVNKCAQQRATARLSLPLGDGKG